jgi:hypothetical protein
MEVYTSIYDMFRKCGVKMGRGANGPADAPGIKKAPMWKQRDFGIWI